MPRARRLAVLLLAFLLAPVLVHAEPCAMPRKPGGLAPASVVRVVDGDTLVVRLADGRSTRVRGTRAIA